MFDTVIVGSGPAGLSAAVYVTRAGFSALIVQGESPGGLLTSTEQIDNYLGMYGATGMDMANSFQEHATKFGAETVFSNVVRIVKTDSVFVTVLDDGSNILSRSVIFAAGSTPRKLGVPGEDLNGVSYCATCDGMFFAGEEVAVVGGGETAVEEALYLSQIASIVDVFVRSDWRASEPAVNNLLAQKNVVIHFGENITEIVGDNEGVSSIKTDLGKTYSVKGIFVAIGQSPNCETASDHVVLYENGFIKKSLVPGFFVCGDISNPEYRQVIIAAGDGAKAGIDNTKFLLTQ